MKLLSCLRAPDAKRVGFSGSLVLASITRTPRNSRLGLASPAMLCDLAMELAQLREGFAAAQPQPLHAQAGR